MSRTRFKSDLYDITAPVYNKLTAITGYARAPRRLVRAFQKVAGRLEGDINVLDFGCGTGRVTDAFLQKMPEAKVTGMEPCEAMMRIYRKAFGDKCKTIADGYDRYDGLPCKNNQYDVVISSGVFDHLEITPRLMREFMRVVKPGGYMAFTFERKVWGKDNYEDYHNGRYYRHRQEYVRECLEDAGAMVKHQERMVGYIYPHVARFGICIAQKPL